jgi:DNA-binding beta-propeller fold protein YncE
MKEDTMRRQPVLLACVAILGLCTLARGAEKLVLVAGGGPDDWSAAGVPAVRAKLDGPFGVALDPQKNLIFVEMTGHRVGKIDAKGMLTLLAGTGQKGLSGDRGPGPKATFNGMHSLAIDPDGFIYLADTFNNCVRKIDPKTGIVTNFAGTGEKGFAGDGKAAAKWTFSGVYSIAFDAKGEKMYIADLDNRRVRMIDMKAGVLSTVAGNGQKGVPQDGAVAVESPLVDPRAVAVDSQGKLYILERSGHALRVVGPNGKIRTIAGTGKAGFSGDGGDALKAELNGPKHLCLDADDNVLIADTENHVIRKYLPREGKIVRVAGTGKKGATGVGGPPQEAELAQPHGVYVGPDGVLYIADSSNHRILKIER